MLSFPHYRNKYRNKTEEKEEETAARTNDKELLNVRVMRSREKGDEDLRNAYAATQSPKLNTQPHRFPHHQSHRPPAANKTPVQ